MISRSAAPVRSSSYQPSFFIQETLANILARLVQTLARRGTTSANAALIFSSCSRLTPLPALSPLVASTPTISSSSSPASTSRSISFAATAAKRPTTLISPSAASKFLSQSISPAPHARRHLSDQVKSAIESAVASAPVVLFMKGTPETPQCGFSRATIQILGLQGVDPSKFHAFNVLEDPELREGVKEFSDWPTIPQLYVDGEFVGGCDIVVSMHQKGELAKLFEEKGVLVLEEEEGGSQGEAVPGVQVEVEVEKK
ncbi:hypothetical protein MKZ38_006017 [Zalerion maritima]|uniref:Monothiol glutaredoxin-5, mitochondrial n=1 Tax=Zalerion maritima TaxID=339359 RepID=A0AAD5WNX8_9PEZI|nr:hypothetical protein MKZ38_006017 [Zalerion maritima]